jgi:hypothetical protein
MSKMIELKNTKTFEEAKKLWFDKTETFYGDYFVIYQKTEDDSEEDELIGITSEDTLKEKQMFNNQFVVLAAGDDCKRAVEGKTITINPAMASSFYPVIYDNIVYQAIPDRAIITTLK